MPLRPAAHALPSTATSVTPDARPLCGSEFASLIKRSHPNPFPCLVCLFPTKNHGLNMTSSPCSPHLELGDRGLNPAPQRPTASVPELP
ncbi:unnamed protein product [Rangifer tarandus platyrhynchus]|uniref:Uncharacterized protein n=2 Tax=Rangifer tarandus platyrhynchus TaxID=3082113 RepID=A0ACB0F044_RANTA|nr:unnamed protein product [Rangifer tarandus platyrhynchus]CAI9706074.1 unnamed protein product [Rangifer tarandus platyrhynchus]